MISPLRTVDEKSRLQALRRLGLLDSEKEERFDRLSRMAARLFDVPIALISLVDENRQWFKSRVGLEVCESNRDISFCGYTILARRPFIIPDALADVRFSDNPLVTGYPNVRFYAGVPLETDDSALVGTLCVIDHRPRHFSEADIRQLEDLAILVRHEINALGRRQMLEAMRVSEEGFAGAFSCAAIGMALVKPDGHWLKVNKTLCDIIGYSEEELLTKSFRDITHPDDVGSSVVALHELLEGTRTSYCQEKRYIHKKGHLVWVFISVSLLRDAKKDPLYFVAQTQDISQRKAAEAELEGVRDEYERILSAVGQGVHWIGIDGRIKFENPASAAMLGYHAADLIGRSAHETMHHTHADGTAFPRSECPIYQTLKDGQVRRISDDVFWRQDGTSFNVEYTCTSIRKQGIPTGVVVTFSDTTQRKKVELEMQSARLAAESANQAKTNFLANMSHEIRTPLNGIIGMTDLLSRTTVTAEQQDFIETIHASGENLLTIVNDVLDFSKIEFGKLELDLYPFNLTRLLKEVMGMFNFRAEAKDLKMVADLEPGLPVDYLGDASRIRQLLINLVANAIKFTERGGINIRISAGDPHAGDTPEMRRLRFEVRDTGIGIPADRLDRLFKVFSQVDTSTTRQYGGSGLGLAICRKLVEMMNGTIWVESEAGLGSTFRFELLLAVTSAPEPEAGDAPVSDLGVVRWNRKELSSSFNILVVEDNKTNQKVAQQILKRLGHESDLACNGVEAVLAAEAKVYDLILMDVHMPEMDGLEAARLIREKAALTGHPRIVAVTADVLKGERELCLEAGMDDYVTKPIKIDSLRTILTGMFTA